VKSKRITKQTSCIPGIFYWLVFTYSINIIYSENATYIDSSIYGYGDKQIIGDTWFTKMYGTTSFITVSRDDCVPLTANTFIQEPGKLLFYLQKINYFLWFYFSEH
jgi:hypothetical protein